MLEEWDERCDSTLTGNSLADFDSGGLPAFCTGPLDPNRANGIASPADDGPALDFCLGHKHQWMGRRHHDGVDVGSVVGHQHTGMVRQFAFHRYPDAREPVDVSAVPHVGPVQTGVVGSCELSGQCTDGGSQGQNDECEKPSCAPPEFAQGMAIVKWVGKGGQKIKGSKGHANKNKREMYSNHDGTHPWG